MLGKVDLLSEEELQTKLREVGDNEEAVKSFFEKRLKEQQHNQGSEHYPLNEMFTYGITNDCLSQDDIIAICQESDKDEI